MKDQSMRSLCDRYWADQCTPEEAEQVLEWLLTPEGQRYYEECLPERIDAADRSSKHSLREEEVPTRLQKAIERNSNVRALPRYRWAVAASLVGFLILGALVWLLVLSHEQWQNVKTAYGQTETVILPDGSQVVLNANSRLSFNREWDMNQDRQVWLEGEAFFSVVHTTDGTKFTVHSGDIAVEVIGTEFNVSNWSNKPEVFLASGKVQLRSERSPGTLMMRPGEMAAYVNENHQFVVKEVDPQLHTAWKDDQLIFQRTPLREVFEMLEHTQGLSIEIRDLDADRLLFTSTLPANQPDLVLKAISKAFDLTISQRNNIVILQKR